jgi:glycosyltransferase involved in cell wall biosynthesis
VKLLVNAAFAGPEAVGISRYLHCLLPPLCDLADVTVLTSSPAAFSGARCAFAVLSPRTRPHLNRLLWEMTALPKRATRQYDCLLCATPEVPPFSRIPTVAVVHDITPLALARVYSTKYKAYFWASLQTLRWAAAVIADSRHTAGDLSRLGLIDSRRIHVVLGGPGLLPPHRGLSEPMRPTPYVLYVGGFMPNKNVPRLVAAFKRLRRPSGMKLVLVGWGSDAHLAPTRWAVQHHELGRDVELLSGLADAELSDLYKGCSVFVYPSLYEGFGLPVLEALAHGAPVVCSSASSLPEVAGSAAVYFNPRSTEEMAMRIQNVLDGTELQGELRRRGPARASMFNWRKAAKMVLDIVKGVAGDGHRR